MVIVLFEHLPVLVEYPHLFMIPILKACRKFMQMYVWNAWKLQKAIDLCPTGGLNYSGIESLRDVEGLQKWESGSLPSESTIRRRCRALDEYAVEVLGPINTDETVNGKIYFEDPARLLRLMVESHGMSAVAKTGSTCLPMLLNVKIDAALLSANL